LRSQRSRHKRFAAPTRIIYDARVTPLAEQWDAILSDQPGDWSQLRLELRLADDTRSERACVILAPLNPWRRDDDFRIGILRFLAAASFGYGAYPGLVRMRLTHLDGEGIEGSLALLGRIEAIEPVATQGPA
jgi:hypothetical protein